MDYEIRAWASGDARASARLQTRDGVNSRGVISDLCCPLPRSCRALTPCRARRELFSCASPPAAEDSTSYKTCVPRCAPPEWPVYDDPAGSPLYGRADRLPVYVRLLFFWASV